MLSMVEIGASQGSLYLYPELMNHPAVCPLLPEEEMNVSAIMSFPADLDVNGGAEFVKFPNKPLDIRIILG